mmetsp:Transcript_26169/g.78566  ORF Transcript_26169/g.78566 Transcript_26169/m.78566 type:complete len:216 (-) Transcript_26169:591-1238(-)
MYRNCDSASAPFHRFASCRSLGFTHLTKNGRVPSMVAWSCCNEDAKALATHARLRPPRRDARAPFAGFWNSDTAKSAATRAFFDWQSVAAAASGSASRFFATKPSTVYVTLPAKCRTWNARPTSASSLFFRDPRNGATCGSSFKRSSFATYVPSAPFRSSHSSSNNRSTPSSSASTTGALSRNVVSATGTPSSRYNRASVSKTTKLKCRCKRSFA